MSGHIWKKPKTNIYIYIKYVKKGKMHPANVHTSYNLNNRRDSPENNPRSLVGLQAIQEGGQYM